MAVEEDPKAPMDEEDGNALREEGAMGTPEAAHSNPDLRKRRSTRIVQAVPLQVTGVDALGRPFQERTSTLVINCHGARYQSKHYVLKNMWVTLEVPHPDPNQPPRNVRGRVAWIQRPRTVRQLFQVAVELELAGNAWGIAFPPEDWFTFPDAVHGEILLGTVPADTEVGAPEAESVPREEAQPAEGPPLVNKNVHVLPAPTNTDTSLQLARQVTRLLTEAKQQIQAAAGEAAAHAVATEMGTAMENIEARIAAARAGLAAEAARAAEKLRQESDARARALQTAAAEALQQELPRSIAPQLEQISREWTERIVRESAAQRAAQDQQAQQVSETLRAASKAAEESAGKVRAAAKDTETNLAARSEAARAGLEVAAHQHELDAAAHRESLAHKAEEHRQQIAAAVSAVETSWQERLAESLFSAQAQLHSAMESEIADGEQAARSLDEQTRAAQAQLQEEASRQAVALQEAGAAAIHESEARMGVLREAVNADAARLQDALSAAASSASQLEQFSSQLDALRQEAHTNFDAQIRNLKYQLTEEQRHLSESLFEELQGRIRSTFDGTASAAAGRFEEQIRELAQPHVTGAEEAVQRLAGGRSLFDAAISMQREKIRAATEEAFAEALAQFRGQLGTVEKSLDDAAQEIVARQAADLDTKVTELKHTTIEELFKSAEWYEKKGQTQLQHLVERGMDQAATQLRERAGEFSSVFASELDHHSRNFVEHAQRQMEEVVRDAFEKTRLLFAEAAETTTAAFTDEIQRQARQELDGFTGEVLKSLDDSREQAETIRNEFSRQLTAEQEAFLRRFQSSMIAVVESSVSAAQGQVQAGMQPLLDSWRGMTNAQQAQMSETYRDMGDRSVEQYRERLENVSNSWMVATVTTLDHQSREVLENVASAAEEKLRETCVQVFAGVAETLRARLQEIAASFNAAKAAGTGR